MTTGNPSTFDRLNNWLSTSLMVKILTIGFLILVLIIPLALIDNIVNERNGRKYEVAQTITNEWSGNQVINGPILTIPITHYEIKYDEEGNTEKILHESYYHFLPEHLEYSGDMEHQKLHRGIYEVAVYETDLASVGTFIKPQIEMRNLEAVSWDEAFLTIGITDMKGIKEDIVIKFGDQYLNIEPGSPIPMIIPAGFHSPISNLKDIQEGTTIDFEYSIQLKGSNDLQFTPLGKTTAIQLQSSWPDPSFTGNFLPDERTITEQGFKASWKVLHLNRNFPQRWLDNAYTDLLGSTAFGVQLYLVADDYQSVMRASKYGLMTIVLTFLVFFLVEIMGKIRIHPIQYILVGLAVSLFYILLISISEHSSFNFAYGIATAGIIGMIYLYSLVVFKNMKHSTILLGVLLGIYAFVFVTLQLVDYALLIGSIGLTLILAITMYLTRNIDWFNLNNSKSLLLNAEA